MDSNTDYSPAACLCNYRDTFLTHLDERLPRAWLRSEFLRLIMLVFPLLPPLASHLCSWGVCISFALFIARSTR